MSRKAVLALADGTVFEGRPFGAEGEAIGEVVFNTGMTGYQEVLSDPSYRGQIVCMTYPHIGNTGVNSEDLEAVRPALAGFIVKEGCPAGSNWRLREGLEEFLKAHGIVGIQGIDTRALTRHIRDRGAQEGCVSTRDEDPTRLVERAQGSPGLIGRDLVAEVTCPGPYAWSEGEWVWGKGVSGGAVEAAGGPAAPQMDLFGDARRAGGPFKVVAFDCGIKLNILRKLVGLGCQVVVVPAKATAAEVLAQQPDGVFLSNGPGDPEGVPYLIETVRALLGRKPIFGICLGHQILGLALGGKTFKLKFGHHGCNHPVKDLTTGKVEITTQNHGFAVDMDSFRDCQVGDLGIHREDILQTHVNLNDGTCEGLLHRSLPLFAVQYHPEASPGPHDSYYLFKRFLALMERERRASSSPPRIRFGEA
jgi:carbamoyl-phosphate synthase small subunit